ncbi:hypothetical protein [Salinisphaera sp.]|uniref:hypothetical protein n=1 Tax=Salinisphaera sp. TaxID=1914330 RepID=UPI002D78F829|nr:hypothetical protein [Salinisphaera sp.]HET7313923.1 hypothetical protein [Salinisphaera sp.]
MADPIFCVLTGDIVKSSALSERALDTVMQALSDMAARMGTWPGETDVRYERFRGDGWQMRLHAPAHALRACLFARAAVRLACDRGETRIGVGIGAAEAGASLAASSGLAFERSGRGLEALGVHRLWRIEGGFDTSAARALALGLFAVCDERSRHWTARQADIFMRLAGPAPPPMNDVADALSVQPQTIQTHFTRAGGHALFEAIEAFESAWA